MSTLSASETNTLKLQITINQENNMNKQSKPCSRKDDIVVQEADGEVLIYD